MPIQIINGFPQYYEFGHYYSRFRGDIVTEQSTAYLDIDLMNDTIGNPIPLIEEDIHLLSIVRDGATLIEAEGYEFISENVVRIIPGLLTGETLVFKKLYAKGEVGPIPQIATEHQAAVMSKETISGVAWTDDDNLNINITDVTLFGGKTRVRTDFEFTADQIEVYLNGQFIAPEMVNASVVPLWKVVGSDTVELDGDYSNIHLGIQIVKKTYEES